MSALLSPIPAVITTLETGEEVLADLDDALYCSVPTISTSSVGQHIRHILDHFDSVLQAVDQKIDYDARRRDHRVETDRQLAMNKISATVKALASLDQRPDYLQRGVLVKSDNNSPAAGWTRSTLARELQYLFSHTIHHFALVALLLRAQGIAPHPGFGVAPSTLRHWAHTSEQN